MTDDAEINDYVLELNVKSFEQQFSWSCGPSSLRTAIYYQFGIDLTDRELSLVCGSSNNGTDEFDIQRGLKMLGFSYKESEKGTLNKLKQWLQKDKLPIVHLVMSDGGGHYMVVCGYDKSNVYLSDPATGGILKYGIPFFMGVWKAEENETQTRWFFVITGKRKDKIIMTINKLKKIQKKLKKI